VPRGHQIFESKLVKINIVIECLFLVLLSPLYAVATRLSQVQSAAVADSVLYACDLCSGLGVGKFVVAMNITKVDQASVIKN
jgi:hypothetical protein